MGGKAALLLILGFSSIMLTVGLNMNRLSTSAVENSASHYEDETAKEIARSGINLAASNLSRNHSWTPNSSYSYMGTNNLKINVSKSGNTTILTSIGTYEGESQLIEVKIELASFSEYAYFSHEEGNIWWTGNDSVWGPFHTNDDIQVKNHPYFAGPRTSHAGSVVHYTNKATDDPTIVGTYTPGITIDIPPDGITNLQGSASSNGYIFSGQSEVFVEFAGDSIKYKFAESDPYTTVLGSTLAPNGVIYVENGDLRLQGTVKGEWSIGSNQQVYIDDNIVYSDVPDPMDENDPSQDLLGIISKNNVYITENSDNNSDVNIHAAIYCEDGSFKAENHSSRDLSGTIHLIGGVTQYKRGPVGTFSHKWEYNYSTYKWEKIYYSKSGFEKKDYKYDSRLLRMVPPYFPSTNTFKILSWLE